MAAFIQYTIFIIVFGAWYYLCFVAPCKKNKKTKPDIFMAGLFFLGYAGQLMTDAALTIVKNLKPSLFNEYDEMVERAFGTYSSPAMLISIFLLAPIGEELLFRGVFLKYLQKIFKPLPCCLINGLLFGIYHGNLIQGIYAFLFGIVLSAIALHFESIIYSIIFHMSVNISVLFSFDFFFETWATCVVTLLISLTVFIALICILFKKSAHPKISDNI